MANFGSSIQTAQISTGNVRTTVDVRDTLKPANGAKNPLGEKYYDVAGVSAANPFGIPVAYRYVRYNSTLNAAVQTCPACVWWTDNTFTTVTSTLAESLGKSFPAGLLMPNSTDITGLTAAILNGNFVFIQVSGWISAIKAAGSTAAGDAQIGTQTDWTTTAGLARTALNTAPINRVVAWAVTSLASSLSDLVIVLES